MITFSEAAKYFGICTKQMRRFAENHLSDFAIFMGNRYLIVRPRFEEYVTAFMESGEKTVQVVNNDKNYDSDRH